MKIQVRINGGQNDHDAEGVWVPLYAYTQDAGLVCGEREARLISLSRPLVQNPAPGMGRGMMYHLKDERAKVREFYVDQRAGGMIGRLVAQRRVGRSEVTIHGTVVNQKGTILNSLNLATTLRLFMDRARARQTS